MADQKWNPDGIFGAWDGLHKPLQTWRYIMTPEEQATVELEDKGVPEGIGGARPPGWAQASRRTSSTLDQIGSGHTEITPAPIPGTPPGYVLDQLSRGEGTADDNPNVKAHYASGSIRCGVWLCRETPTYQRPDRVNNSLATEANERSHSIWPIPN